jgi:hypothetical protein
MMHEVSKQITIEKSIEDGVVAASMQQLLMEKLKTSFEGTDEVQAKLMN